MDSDFRSATDFLEYIRTAYGNPLNAFQGQANPEFLKIYDEKVRQVGEPLTGISPLGISSYEHIAQSLWSDIKAIMPPVLVEKLGPHLIVGALDNTSVNALCIRSREGFTVIGLNAGLMLFLNKISKLQVASVVPHAILYCNRAPPHEITPAIIRSWYLEVTEHYRTTRKPLGPQIHLTPEADGQHATQLHLWEMFVLCHELGHALAGHLDRDELWSQHPSFGMLESFREDESHEMEMEADLLGYILLREHFYMRVLKEAVHDDQRFDDRPFFLPMITFFDLMFLLGSSESATHPHPLDRLCNITEAIYGKKKADELANSYDDPPSVIGVLSQPLTAPAGLLQQLVKCVGSSRR